MTTCKRCGKKLYKNDYCASCQRELTYKCVREYLKEHPSEKHTATDWIESDLFTVELRKKRHSEKRARQTNYNIGVGLRSVVRNAITSKSEKNKNVYKELIGCTPNELKVHIESQFKNGMSWTNYGVGGWQVDHIIPCVYYDLFDIEEQKRCFHYSNLQPMWAVENFDKNASVGLEFGTEMELKKFMDCHKLPASAKVRARLKGRKVIYSLAFKVH